MSNQIRRNLGRFMFSPASFFRQHPIVIAGKLSLGMGVVHIVLDLGGLSYWSSELRTRSWEYVKACRERCESMTADLETMEREIDSIKKKQLHARVQKGDDTKTKADLVCRVG